MTNIDIKGRGSSVEEAKIQAWVFTAIASRDEQVQAQLYEAALSQMDSGAGTAYYLCTASHWTTYVKKIAYPAV